jgi:hypothetical protein
MDNPFYHRGPIDQPGAALGREREIAAVMQLLCAPGRGTWVELTGPHRIGKSTLLCCLEAALRVQQPRWRVGRVSLQSTLTNEDVWRRTLHALGGDRRAENPRDGVEALLSGLDAGQQAVLLLDELPVLAAEGRDPNLFGLLRGLGEDFPLRIVSAAPQRMREFVPPPPPGVSLPWANAQEQAVGPFEAAVARRFLEAYSQPDPFSEAESAELIALSGGHPWRLMMAAWHRWAARAAGQGDWRAAYERERQNESREVVGGAAQAAAPTYEPGGSDEIRVFVSSPMAGIEGERAAVRQACAAIGLVAVMAEDFGARDGTSRAVCLGELERCQALVLIMPDRYGAPTDQGVSATQEEVEKAGSLGISRLVYVAAPLDRRPWWERLLGARGPDQRQAAWIAALTGSFGEGLFHERYASAQNLEQKVGRDLGRLLRRWARWAWDRRRE